MPPTASTLTSMDRRNLLLVAIPTALLGTFLAFYGLNRALTSDVIGRNVAIAGVDASGLTIEEALATMTTHGDLLSGTQIPVEADGNIGEVSPISLGLSPDVTSAVADAYGVGRGGGFFGDLGSWLSRLSGVVDVGLPVSADALIYEAGIGFLDENLIGDPAFAGTVEIVDGDPVARYPREGTEIDAEAARPLLEAAFVQTSRAPVTLPTVRQVPPITDADVDAAVAEAEVFLAGPIRLTTDDADRTLTYGVDDLEAAFGVRIEGDTMVLDLDDAAIRSKVDPLLDELATPPVNAQLLFDRERLRTSIKPGSNGTKVDTAALEAAILAAYPTPDRSGALPLEVGAEPDITTEYLEGLNINHLVSRFTTYHSCCEPDGSLQNRVNNIHIIADAADGIIVPPGGTFDLNAVAGRRTEDKGYLPAGGIIGGEIDPEIIGGGISQFTTTMYNAVFWGGYEDVDHKPHTYYFSRYPMGIEATLDYVSVPLIWRNNDDDGVYVNTYYTNESITVEFWGDNDGRTLVGDHRAGETNIRVAVEGGPDAKRVRGDIGEPRDPVEPGEVLQANPDVKPGTRKEVESGIAGFTVDVTRTIEHDGRTTEQTWTWRYQAKPAVIDVHPCDLPGGPACPVPTTLPPSTTVPPSTPPPSTEPTTTTTTTTPPPSDG